MHRSVSTNLVGDGGGYEIPLWLGDNKLFWPDNPAPGTSSVLLLCTECRLKLGRLCLRTLSCFTSSVLEEIALLVFVAAVAWTPLGFVFKWNVYRFVLLWLFAIMMLWLYLDFAWRPWVDPSSLDNELVFSKSTDIFRDSFNSTDPLWLLPTDLGELRTPNRSWLVVL